MRVILDPERCQGHGRCYTLTPELFEPDDLGHCVVLPSAKDVPPELREAALSGVANCPEQALSVEE
ncbi:MAG: ferredoxin [Acidimicrobiales bacterium]